MSEFVLYRKYRPTSFADVVGQDHVVKTLVGALVGNRVSHGYLFAGPRGTGKTTIARLLAKAVNCEDRGEDEHEPCNKCASCKEFGNLTALDLIEIDAASNRGIDEIRELRDGIKFVPTRAKYKVFIIDEVHMLTREAFNALLKTLEEPPGHAIFVLATTEIEKIPPTILSRVQKFDFRRFSPEEVTDRLKKLAGKEKITIDEPALRLIAQASEGSMRDAESLLDQMISFEGNNLTAQQVEEMLGTVNVRSVHEFLEYVIALDARRAVDFINETHDAGYDMREFLKAVVSYVRKLMLLKIDATLKDLLAKELTEEQLSTITVLAGKVSLQDVRHLMNHFLEAADTMKKTNHLMLPVEMAAVSYIEENKKVHPVK